MIYNFICLKGLRVIGGIKYLLLNIFSFFFCYVFKILILEIFWKFIVFCLFSNLFILKFMKLNMYDGYFWELINFSEMILVKI